VTYATEKAMFNSMVIGVDGMLNSTKFQKKIKKDFKCESVMITTLFEFKSKEDAEAFTKS